MNITPQMILFICPLTFLAGFVDSIAGGGGLISLPSYLFIGLPVHFAYGTNKFSSTFGTLLSVFRFSRSKRIDYRSALLSAAGALLGSFLGARAALALDEIYLKYCLLVLLPVIAVFIFTRKGFGEENRTFRLSGRKVWLLSALAGLVVGAYDGFFGPGTGTFLILIYTGIIGFDMVTASGNAKVVNASSNIAALAAFLFSGKVLLPIAIPAALFGILGNWVGSGLAVKNGARIIKPMFVVVITLLFIKIGMDIIR